MNMSKTARSMKIHNRQRLNRRRQRLGGLGRGAYSRIGPLGLVARSHNDRRRAALRVLAAYSSSAGFSRSSMILIIVGTILKPTRGEFDESNARVRMFEWTENSGLVAMTTDDIRTFCTSVGAGGTAALRLGRPRYLRGFNLV
jgi:hypothetical protein